MKACNEEAFLDLATRDARRLTIAGLSKNVILKEEARETAKPISKVTDF